MIEWGERETSKQKENNIINRLLVTSIIMIGGLKHQVSMFYEISELLGSLVASVASSISAFIRNEFAMLIIQEFLCGFSFYQHFYLYCAFQSIYETPRGRKEAFV